MRKYCFRQAAFAGVFSLVLFFIFIPAFAQDEPVTLDDRVDPAVINLKIAEVEGSTQLDETTAGILLDLYRRALTNLERARLELDNAETFTQSGANAPDELARTRGEIEKLRSTSAEQTLKISARTKQADLEQLLSDEKAALIEARSRVAELREQYAREVSRPAIARDRLGKAQGERDTAISDGKATPPIGEAAAITEARRWNLEARAQKLSGEIRKLDQEILTHDLRLQLLEARQELAGLELERARTQARMLEDAISERRGAEAELARAEAESTQLALEGQHPLVRDLAVSNVELSDRMTSLNQAIQTASDKRDTIRNQFTELNDQLDSTGNKLAVAGMNQALGQLLVEQRRLLPSFRKLNKQAKDSETEVARVGLEQIDLSDQRKSLRDIDAYLDDLTSDLPEEESETVRSELKPLVESRVTLVDKSLETNARYLQVLGELDMALQQFSNAVKDYGKFLDSTLLWVRNSSPINEQVFKSIPRDIRRLLSPSGWKQLFTDLGSALRTNVLFVLMLATLLVLGLLRSRFLTRVDEMAQYVGRISRDRFRYSIKSLFYTILAAAPLPLLLVIGGLTIQNQATSAVFTVAFSSVITVVGIDILIVQFFIDGCRDKGLLPVHCSWSQDSVKLLRKELSWFLLVFPITRLISEVSFNLDSGGQIGGLTVVGAIVAAGAMGLLVYRLFSSYNGVANVYLVSNPTSVLAQTRPIWAPGFALVMPSLLILWLAGYNYTGHVLAISFMYSVWLILWLLVVLRLLARWLTLGYQKLEYNAAIARRDAARAARRAAMAAQEGKKPAEEPESDADEPEIDFKGLSSDSRNLLRTFMVFNGVAWLWVIWAPILPALRVLNEIGLWSKSSVLKGEIIPVPVTLADILWAVIIGIATGAAAKGLPALLELFLLQRTKMTVGGRYTATTLLRYSIIAAGLIIAIGLLGIGWSNAQWLVAALGVGIGFGLQEIVANFISGLVLLFERPIRVGDTVTVGETSGTVTRIQIRATTIRDFDHRELLVPNKEFITGRLLNWSLSDEIVRTIIPVGIAYGSNVELALKLLGEVAAEHEQVLDDPKPVVFFEEFGDSSLILSLRAHVSSSDFRLQVKSELLQAINRKFADAGIVIAFPQSDIHLNTSQPLEIQMKPATE